MSAHPSNPDLSWHLSALNNALADAAPERLAGLLRRLLVLQPGSPKFWSRLGKDKNRNGETSPAATYLVRSYFCANGSPQARSRLAGFLRATQSVETEVSTALLHDLLGPNDPTTLAISAMASLESGDFDDARRQARRAEILTPGCGRAWAVLALSAGISNDETGALRAWWIARTADPTAFAEHRGWPQRLAARNGVHAGALPLLVGIARSKSRNVRDRDGLIRLVAECDGPAERGRRRLPVVTQPLVLISQIQRSGGSMIIELLDNHPEVFAYPYELILGKPQKSDWPDLDLSAGAEQWMAELFEPRLPLLSLRGFAKSDLNRFATDRVPFAFDVPGMIGRFLRANRTRPGDQRELLNRYFTAYFRSWADYRESGRERWVAAFAPRLVMRPLSMRRYRRDYPDGHLVGSIRHPRSWLISAQRHSRQYQQYGPALELWQMSAEALLEQHLRAPEATTLLIYEELVAQPEAELRRLTADLGIEFRPSLLTPTLSGRPLCPGLTMDPGVRCAAPE